MNERARTRAAGALGIVLVAAAAWWLARSEERGDAGAETGAEAASRSEVEGSGGAGAGSGSGAGAGSGAGSGARSGSGSGSGAGSGAGASSGSGSGSIIGSASEPASATARPPDGGVAAVASGEEPTPDLPPVPTEPPPRRRIDDEPTPIAVVHGEPTPEQRADTATFLWDAVVLRRAEITQQIAEAEARGMGPRAERLRQELAGLEAVEPQARAAAEEAQRQVRPR